MMGTLARPRRQELAGIQGPSVCSWLNESFAVFLLAPMARPSFHTLPINNLLEWRKSCISRRHARTMCPSKILCDKCSDTVWSQRV